HVLFIDMELQEIADQLKIPKDQAAVLLERGCSKMKQARGRQRSPLVDPTVYTAWNGMMIVALLESWKAFGVEVLKEAALACLASVLGGHRLPSGLMSHRHTRFSSEAFLEDQTAMLEALIAAFDATGNARHLANAELLAEAMIKHFWDEEETASPQHASAFNDVPKAHERLGTLAVTHKPIQDSPTPSPNGVAALALLSLSALTGNKTYRDRAERILRYFAGGVAGSGLFAGTYFLGIQRLLYPPLHVVTTGGKGDARIDALHDTAVRTFRPGKIVSRIGPSNDTHLPPEVKALIGDSAESRAVVCGSTSCSAPVSDAEELRLLIQTFDRKRES
ncbi:MAG: thioredoxin domain-containing protein, partial [Proteobacteria bacterium]|nr:thioredoxin domain-containing protein [Pseudomonadota bacterium]